jgi:hypothetical protein
VSILGEFVEQREANVYVRSTEYRPHGKDVCCLELRANQQNCERAKLKPHVDSTMKFQLINEVAWIKFVEFFALSQI